MSPIAILISTDVSVRSNPIYNTLVTPCAARQVDLQDIQCGDCIAFRKAQGVREYVRGEESACCSVLLPRR